MYHYLAQEWEVYRFLFEMVSENMYFIPSGNTGIVIDPNENEELLEVFKQYGTKDVVIVLTHEHYDHTTGVEWLQTRIESKLICHKACAEAISSEKGNDPKTLGYILTLRDVVDGGHRRDDYLVTAKHYALQADKTFEKECEIVVGKIKIRCRPAPGHSPGSVLLFLGENLFSGDSLIQHTPTIVHLPGSDRKVFKAETKPYLQSLDKNTMVYPGHGEPFLIRDSKFLY